MALPSAKKRRLVRMKNEKILWYIIGIAVILAAGFFSGYTVRKAVDDKSIREYRSTITELRNQLTKQIDRIDELEQGNQQLTNQAEKLRQEIGDLIERLENTKGTIEEIKSGISADIRTISDIRKAIRSIIQAIEQLEEAEQNPGNS